MSDLLDQIRRAQIEAGERVVIENLRAKLGPKVLGEIVNPHVLEHVEEPKPDFDAMNRLIRGEK